MSYEVTATRKRPQNFDQLAGQEFVSATLAASLASGRIAHAYLFSGPRGCGKTSTARILAKALNCEQGPTANPCGICDSCKAVVAGSSLDVIEIDGASNTSVDNVRQIKDEVLFPPSIGRYKIYIIDEVHMLSTSAFNALLKTIEEPPPYVIFMFATTELHKVPATIKSRCQQFAFRLVPADTVQALLAAAAAESGVEAEPEALLWMARESGGSVRDAYTLLDQVISFANGKITASLIRDKLGLVGQDRMNALLRACLGPAAAPKNDAAALKNGAAALKNGAAAPKNDAADPQNDAADPQNGAADQESGAAAARVTALGLLDEILDAGVSPEQFLGDLAEFCRALLLLKHGVTRESLLGAPLSSFDPEILEALSAPRIEHALAMTLDAYRSLRFSVEPRFELELLVAKLSHIKEYIAPSDLARAVSGLRRAIESGAIAGAAASTTSAAFAAPSAAGIAPPAASTTSAAFAAPSAAAPLRQPWTPPSTSSPALSQSAQAQPAMPQGAATTAQAQSQAAHTVSPLVPLHDMEALKAAVVADLRPVNAMVSLGLSKSADWVLEGNQLQLPLRSAVEVTLLKKEATLIAAHISQRAGRALKVTIEQLAADETSAIGVADEPAVRMVQNMFRGDLVGLKKAPAAEPVASAEVHTSSEIDDDDAVDAREPLDPPSDSVNLEDSL